MRGKALVVGASRSLAVASELSGMPLRAGYANALPRLLKT